MSSSNCCFLACIQISQEAGQVVWYSHLSQNFPQLIVIHTVKGFSIVNKAEIDVFLELSCFFHDPEDVGFLISGSSAFSKTSLSIREFMVSPKGTLILSWQEHHCHDHHSINLTLRTTMNVFPDNVWSPCLLHCGHWEGNNVEKNNLGNAQAWNWNLWAKFRKSAFG